MANWFNQKSLGGVRNEDKKNVKCPECGSNEIEYDGVDLVCKKCGLVIEE